MVLNELFWCFLLLNGTRVLYFVLLLQLLASKITPTYLCPSLFGSKAFVQVT